VLYPPTDTEQFEPGAKQNVILSVGRFFVGRHCKKQDVLIRTFQSLYQTYPEMLNWEYHLVGGIDPNAPSSLYAERCERQARGYPIMFHVNAPFDLLQQLYSHAKIFWHAAGFGEDEVRRPDCMEHFGIATVEAMAAGCVPVVVGKGGQREVVQAGMNGLYWSTCDELAQQTRDLIRDDTRLAALRANAQARSQDFGMAAFERMLERVLELDDG
jgi:glycosyltransferase involved in cell wall biosynthesis